jgi:hypothetical protein
MTVTVGSGKQGKDMEDFHIKPGVMSKRQGKKWKD